MNEISGIWMALLPLGIESSITKKHAGRSWLLVGPDWWPSTVYGPSRDEGKPTFLVELYELRQVQSGRGS
jgi:hypothetical protein